MHVYQTVKRHSCLLKFLKWGFGEVGNYLFCARNTLFHCRCFIMRRFFSIVENYLSKNPFLCDKANVFVVEFLWNLCGWQTCPCIFPDQKKNAGGSDANNYRQVDKRYSIRYTFTITPALKGSEIFLHPKSLFQVGVDL